MSGQRDAPSPFLSRSFSCQLMRTQYVGIYVLNLRRLTALLVLTIVATPVPAVAQTTKAPPGNSAVDEYLETVPAPDGSRSVGGSGAAPKLSPGGGDAVPKQTRAALSAQGDDGRAAAALAEATSPDGARPPDSPRDASTAKDRTPSSGSREMGSPASAGGGSGAAAVGRVLTADPADGGLGLLLPIGMASVLVAAGLTVLLRRRSST